MDRHGVGKLWEVRSVGRGTLELWCVDEVR
jgi:hypothetical protein